ncbi:MAG: alpha/beta fold hydrolase [Planctomycetota bacterium]|jgi:predicted esterase
MKRLAALALALAFAAPAHAKKRKGPEVVEEPDGGLTRIFLKEDGKAQAWLYKPAIDEEETPKVDLIVALHGAGGNPKNFMMRRLMERRKAWCLAVAGRQQVQTERGVGFQWSTSDRAYVAEFVRYLTGKYPIRKERVLVWGHSAGGTMTLASLAYAPELFAGGLTTAAPATPDSQHSALRVAVFLGDQDPNWGGAAGVRSYVERLAKKRKKGACAFFGVKGLGHSVPADEYLGLGFEWILQPKARGGEATVGTDAKGQEGELRMILVRHKGAEGARGIKRSKGAAQKLLKKLKKELSKGRAYFPFEAACHSDDAESASCGGGIETEALEEHGLELPQLQEGEVSEILAGKRGLYLIQRP